MINTATTTRDSNDVNSFSGITIPPDQPDMPLHLEDASVSLVCLLLIVVVAVFVVLLGRHR